MNRVLIVVIAAITGIAVAGCGSSKPAGLTIITVTGVVTTPDGPVANAKVQINDRPVVTTASDGSFTVSEVTVPYDALVGNAATNSAVLYQGLTRPDPDLNFGELGTSVPPVRKAKISGTVSNSNPFPFPAGSCTLLSFGSVDFNVPLSTNNVAVALDTGLYSKNIAWRGGSSLSGTAHALQWNYNTTTLLPTAFTWHGSRYVTVNVGDDLSGQDVVMSAVSASSPVSGEVKVPTDYTMNSRWFEVYLDPDKARIPVFCEVTGSAPPCKTNTPITPAFNFVVPSIPGTTATVWVNAIKGTNPLVFSQVRQCDILPGTVGVNLALPLPPAQDSPPDGADPIGVGTRFSWSAFPDGGIHGLLFTEDPLPIPTLEPVLTVYTAGTEVILPDLAPVGLSWPAAKTYSWRIAGYAPATVDQWADPIIQLGCNFTQAWADKRTFKTP